MSDLIQDLKKDIGIGLNRRAIAEIKRLTAESYRQKKSLEHWIKQCGTLSAEHKTLSCEGRAKDLLLEAYEEACSDDINERVKESVEKYLDGHSQ